MNNVYCVCTTPDLYNHYGRHWDNFVETGHQLRWVCDISKNKNFKLDFDYTEEDIRNNFKFDKEVSKQHYWNSQGNRNIIWFYPHFRMLNFYLKNTEYDYYWFFDDDVKSKNWNEFLKGFESDKSDFISYFIFKNIDVESQINVPKIDSKTFSKELWFSRFPGHGDILPNNIKELFGSFFPVVRFSNKAMQYLLKIHQDGFYGYSEGYVPTILNYLGLEISTIYTPENKSKYFNDEIVDIKHKNIKIEWSWI